MAYWEILLIERGYYRRNILQYQLQRLQAYGAMFAFSGDKRQKGPDGWIPLYFDKYKREENDTVSQEVVDILQAEMDAINAQIAAEQKNRTQ